MCKSAGKVYRIEVRSELRDGYATVFEGMETKSGLTVLSEEVIDQPPFYGILDHISGLGLELVSAQSLPEASKRRSEFDTDEQGGVLRSIGGSMG
jgi:hypothetical protein